MNREQYQAAFSRLEPSEELISAALARTEPRKNPARRRVGSVLLAAALAVAVLAGTALAAVQFGWLSVKDAESLVQPTHDAEAFGLDENLPPDPQNLLKLEGTSSDTWIGFTLPESYLEGQDSLNSWMLGAGLYRRYYRNPDPSDPKSPLLTAEIRYDGSFLTRCGSELVKADTLGGMETVWFKLDSSPDGRAQYILFQRNDALGCYAVIASTEGFREAEQLALDMQYQDSGLPLAQKEDELYYGFRLSWEPEDMIPDSRTVMADRWYLANATLRDETQDLSELLLSANWVCVGESSVNVGISLVAGLTDIAPVEYGTVLKTETLDGRTVRWVEGSNGSTFVQVLYREKEVQLVVSISRFGPDSKTGDVVELPVEEQDLALAERLLASAELVPVPIAEPAPAEFAPFSVG